MAAARRTIVLFDVDGTLTPSRKVATPAILAFLQALRGKVRAATTATRQSALAPRPLWRWKRGGRPGMHGKDGVLVSASWQCAGRARWAARVRGLFASDL